jgi:transmembrane sensor
MSATGKGAALVQAAQWYATLQAGDATAADRRRWQDWLLADPAHRSAWQKVEAVSRQFDAVPAQEPALAALRLPRARRSAVKKLLALAAVATVGGVVSQPGSRDYLAALGAGEKTAVGEIRKLALVDGSELWMNTDSAIDIDFSATLRRILLHRGEILLHGAVATAQAARPLAVDLAQGRLSASGTRFSVARDGPAATLAVFEGEVRVDLAADGGSRVVQAGTRLQFAHGAFGAAGPVDDMADAWTRRRLSVDRMRLGDFIAALARYRHGHLGCDRAVADLLLTGSYPVDDMERVFTALEKTLPVRVKRIMPWWVTIEALA